MGTLRIVLDTNVLVSGLAYPATVPGQILSAWKQGGVELALSRDILDELVRVLPRLRPIALNAAEIRDLADSFLFLAEIVAPVPVPEETLRDPAGLPVLGTLLAARADYLIAGDKDILALGALFPILTPAEFWERHGRWAHPLAPSIPPSRRCSAQCPEPAPPGACAFR